jgi:hypothetical protein
MLGRLLLQVGGRDFVSEAEAVIDEVANAIVEIVHYLILKGIELLIQLVRPLYGFLIILGVILYFSRIDTWRGRGLLTGGIILALLTELLFPMLLKMLQ